MAQMVKNLPAMQETQVRSLGQEDPLEKEMAVHFSILPWRIPWTEDADRLRSKGSKRVRHIWVTNAFTFLFILLQKAIGILFFFFTFFINVNFSIFKNYGKNSDMKPSLLIDFKCAVQYD